MFKGEIARPFIPFFVEKILAQCAFHHEKHFMRYLPLAKQPCSFLVFPRCKKSVEICGILFGYLRVIP